MRRRGIHDQRNGGIARIARPRRVANRGPRQRRDNGHDARIRRQWPLARIGEPAQGGEPFLQFEMTAKAIARPGGAKIAHDDLQPSARGEHRRAREDLDRIAFCGRIFGVARVILGEKHAIDARLAFAQRKIPIAGARRAMKIDDLAAQPKRAERRLQKPLGVAHKIRDRHNGRSRKIAAYAVISHLFIKSQNLPNPLAFSATCSVFSGTGG